MAELLTVWTIRTSLILFAASLIGWILDFQLRFRWLWQIFWTIGFVLAVAHVASAFQFYHAWSHRLAYEDTAKKTNELLGWSFGAGVYFNYLFILVWGLDVGSTWLMRDPILTSVRWLRNAGLIYLVFIALNGTVVFESGPSRTGGILAILMLSAAVLIRWRRVTLRKLA